MLKPGYLPLQADRQTPFVCTLSYIGIDLTGAAFKAQVRDRKDGGNVYADLTTVGTVNTEGFRLAYAGSATVSAHVAAGRGTLAQFAEAGFVGADTVTLSQVAMRINELTMEAMPFDGVIGDDLGMWWDQHITPSGGTKEKYLFGEFVVRAGVTQ